MKGGNAVEMRIERVDNLPIIITWLLRMRVNSVIDSLWRSHGKWQGLSYGQLALLFVAYIIQRRTHQLMGMESWLTEHRTVIASVTGWTIGDKEATDDRLGILLTTLGEDDGQAVKLQKELSQHVIQAFDLPTEVARYDTSSFSVHHAVPEAGEAPHQLLKFGHSKDKRPDLLQFKEGLGTLDPAGVPLVTHTLSGETADDGLYLPAWWQIRQTLGRSDFLLVADSKAAAIPTRATIASHGGCYLFPLPMTGETPAWLRGQVGQATVAAITLPEVKDEKGQPKQVGVGFTVNRPMCYELSPGVSHTWQEQWFVTRSDSLREKQQAALQRRLTRTRQELERLRPSQDETELAFSERVTKVLTKRDVTAYFDVKVQETIYIRKRYLKKGRPGSQTPYELETTSRLNLVVTRQEEAIVQAMQLAGWRIHVSNATPVEMNLVQSVRYYRDEWLVERGYHRFKNGSLPALPLYLRLPERIRGLMLLLFIALQALTLIEFVAKHSLTDANQTIDGLVPGNPKMKTDRPSAERLLAAFGSLHLLIKEAETVVSTTMVEALTPLQQRILALLHLPTSIYDLDFASVPP